ncbi:MULTISPECIES: hypothetical protein [unclassified Streptomyces]|uniref:hypothetical protein n=1 Tax=unclassified Streptomyces TaxID=2593676 RepID=UPI0029A3DC70|nr:MULTISPECIES: hypothetical protein [unclassified Streptomyces]MDX3820742.1 hypothetical protein [Streptomyces sp. AK08-01A]
MSAAAAPAAPPDHSLWNSVDGASAGRSRRQLRSVPAQARPVAPLELGNPLQLSKTMRARLLAAVRALVTSPALAGASDGARLAAVVLTAKSKVRNDYQASIWAAELGRWLGVSRSTVAHTVLPELRGAGFLGSNVATNAFGHATGLECWVIPMYRAQKAGDRRHALALSRSELAVLLSLIEVLFGPGWTPNDKAPVPAGLLAGRRGRGAATDRLGLLLMVLTTGSAGWLQLCPGSVDTVRGRPAATVGRLLGCTAAAGAKVLKRLQEHGVADLVRQETGSGLHARSRVRLVPVAEAHGVAVQEARRVANAAFSDLAGTASGDLESVKTGETRMTTGVEGTGQGKLAGSADLATTAQHHALHASVVAPAGSLTLSGGFSGEGRGGSCELPDRACVREDGRPLCGEQRKKSPVVEDGKGGRGPVAGAPVRVVDGSSQGRPQRGRVPLPPEDLRAVLAPVDLVLARLERPAARKLVEAAARSELDRVVEFAGRTDAPQVLADRVAQRLEDQMRLAGPIKDPVGWLIGLALPQRQQCGDVRCDDRVLLDSGQDCPHCAERHDDRRDQRRAVAAAVDAAMPGASETERRAATEQQLHQDVTARAWAKAYEWEQVRARQAAAKARAEAAAVQPADAASVAPVVLPAPRPVAVIPASAAEPSEVVDDQELVLEELTREQVLDWRNRAAADHQLVFDHIDRYGESSAQRLFTRAYVAQVQRLSGLGHLNLGYTPWGQA